MPNKREFLIIDHSSLVFRSWFAVYKVPEDKRVNAAGKLFYNWLKTFQNERKPKYAASIMDVNNRQSENFQQNVDYKTGRHTDQLLKDNFQVFEEISKSLGYQTFGIDGNEADDTIATIVKKLHSTKNQPHTAVIVSGDKDILQLVNDEKEISVISLINGGGQKQWFEEQVKDYFKLDNPSLIAEYKALVGDGSDGYTGVSGVGGGKGSTLVNKYQTLDNIYSAVASGDIKGKLAEHLIEDKDYAYTCYQLAKLNQKLKMPQNHRNLRSLLVSRTLNENLN